MYKSPLSGFPQIVKEDDFFFLLKRLENNKTCPSGEEQPFHSFLGGRGDVLPLPVAGKVKE